MRRSLIALAAFAVQVRSAWEEDSAIVIAFGCSTSYQGKPAHEVYEGCHHDLVHFEHRVAGALACARAHWNGSIALVLPTPAFNRTIEHVTHYVFDERLLSSGIATQIFAAHASPFERSLWLDADTCIMSNRFVTYFTMLEWYDWVSVWECCAVGAQGRVPNDGWEPQTGTFGIRASAKPLLLAWAEEYGDGSRYHYSSATQNAMHAVFLHSPYRFYPLQAQYNWRHWTVPLYDSSHIVGDIGSRRPIIMHTHALDGSNGADRLAAAERLKDQVFCDTCEHGGYQRVCAAS
jgi:hypothetical protein